MPNELSGVPAADRYRGEVALAYDADREAKQSFWEDQAVIERIMSELPPGLRIADIPSGTGRSAAAILRSGSHQYVGIDISRDMMNALRSKIDMSANADRVELLVGSALDLPLLAGSVDVIICVKFIKWLPTDEHVLAVLREFRRVCRGSVFLNVKVKRQAETSANSGWFRRFSRRARGEQFSDAARENELRTRTISVERFVELAQQAGYRTSPVPGGSGRAPWFVLNPTGIAEEPLSLRDSPAHDDRA